MDAGTTPGFFGKVPAVGDFVSRRLPRSFIDPWDEWLQSAMVASRKQLKDDWLDTYLTSPIWRFALSDGLDGSAPCSGVLMPSVDKAGRYFPITLATFLPANTNLFDLAAGSQHWYEEAEDVALSVLAEPPVNVESLDASVIALGELVSGDVSVQDKPGSSHEAELQLMHVSISSLDDVTQALTLMTKHFAELQFGSYSLWWSAGSEDIEPTVILCGKLPAVEDYAAMLSGQWQGHGCHDLTKITIEESDQNNEFVS